MYFQSHITTSERAKDLAGNHLPFQGSQRSFRWVTSGLLAAGLDPGVRASGIAERCWRWRIATIIECASWSPRFAETLSRRGRRRCPGTRYETSRMSGSWPISIPVNSASSLRPSAGNILSERQWYGRKIMNYIKWPNVENFLKGGVQDPGLRREPEETGLSLWLQRVSLLWGRRRSLIKDKKSTWVNLSLKKKKRPPHQVPGN